MLEEMPSVLPGVFNPDMAVLFQERLITHGVEVRLGEGLRAIYGDPVKGVRMDRGDTACDAVVLAGVSQTLQWLDQSQRLDCL